MITNWNFAKINKLTFDKKLHLELDSVFTRQSP